MQRLSVTDFPLGIALHTCGHPLRTKVLREESGAPPRLSAWIDHDVAGAVKLVAEMESGRLAQAWPRHPVLAASAGIQCLQGLEQWLRNPAARPVWTVLPATGCDAVTAAPAAITLLPLRSTDDLATAAAHIALGFLPAAAELRNAGDGSTAALPLLSVSVHEPLLTRELAASFTGPACEHPFAYALYGARNWIQFRLRRDPSQAREFTALLRGVGTRSAVVSRRLLDSTATWLEVPLPDGTTRRVRNRFRDQMLRHLRGFAASDA